MNSADNRYEPLSVLYKPDAYELKRGDFFIMLCLFCAVFAFSLYGSLFSIEFLFDAGLGGYIKCLCLLLVFALSLFYVKGQKGASGLSTAFFTLCSLCFALPYAVNGGDFYCAPAFLYLTGAALVTKTGSLTQKRNSYRYLSEELKDIFICPLRYCFLPARAILKKVRLKRNKKICGSLLGCLLALPVVGVLFTLLSSGDAAFSNASSRLTKLFSSLLDKLFADDPEILFTVAQASAKALIFGTLIFSALFCFRHRIQKREKTRSPHAQKSVGRFIPENLAAGFYVLICLLYIFYLFSQLSYFFGAFSGKIPLAVNMTLSEYARQGFFEMSAIAFINLGLIALGMAFLRLRENGKIAPLFKGVFTFLCVFTELLIVTAVSKMALYITELGLTHKRILVCIIDLILFVTVLCVLTRLYSTSFPYMKIIVGFCCAALSLYTLIGDGVLIAAFNTYAYLNGYHEDYDVHTVRLEADDYHALKSFRKVAAAGKEKSFDAKNSIGVLLSNNTCYDNEIFEQKLTQSTAESFFSSCCITDFLFWEYAKDNRELMKECMNLYDQQLEENLDGKYYYGD
ncbi:MAG: DUF4173 domain-containing protein [Ruminococcaceae bacterium]|nr:DUF4173 domain-containing protein [Oscillospiraceae bacterium]